MRLNLLDRFYLILLHPREAKYLVSDLKKLLDSEFLSRSELDQLQTKKLKRIVEHARLSVPFWKNSLTNLKTEEYLSSEEILDMLQVLTKQKIRDAGSDIWSVNVTNYQSASTGGTTGKPLIIRRDIPCISIAMAALWRAKISWGLRPYHRVIYLKAFGKGTLKGKMRMWLANKRNGQAFPPTEEEAELIGQVISHFKPSAIEGFPTGLLDVSNRLNSPSIPPVSIVISTGEMLYPHQRAHLEGKFQGKVYSYYGSNEIGSIAYECEYQQLHICEEHVIVETLDENDSSVMNAEGRVVVTNLDNFAMPFIRYELGDVAILSSEKCACGRESKVISKLLGRSQDYLKAESGRKIQATQLAGYLRNLKHVGNLQFCQEGHGPITMTYDGSGSNTKAEIQLISDHLHERLGVNILNPVQVTEIDKTSRGKAPLIKRFD